jgi:hypothetical protein
VDGTPGHRRKLPLLVLSFIQLVRRDLEASVLGGIHQMTMVATKERHYRRQHTTTTVYMVAHTGTMGIRIMPSNEEVMVCPFADGEPIAIQSQPIRAIRNLTDVLTDRLFDQIRKGGGFQRMEVVIVLTRFIDVFRENIVLIDQTLINELFHLFTMMETK